MFEEAKYWPQDPPHGGLPPEINFAPDPEVQCCSCNHLHEVALYAKDDRTITGCVYICTQEQDEPEHIVDINAWHNINDCDYDGDGDYR